MILKPDSFDFGNIPINKQIKFLVAVTNNSNKTVIIDTKPYCSSCTTAKARKSHLPPNETTQIDLVFTPTTLGDNFKVVGVLENNFESNKIIFKSNVI